MQIYKTFITSVFSVVFSGAQNPSTEYKFEYEYEKSFITSGPGGYLIRITDYAVADTDFCIRIMFLCCI